MFLIGWAAKCGVSKSEGAKLKVIIKFLFTCYSSAGKRQKEAVVVRYSVHPRAGVVES